MPSWQTPRPETARKCRLINPLQRACLGLATCASVSPRNMEMIVEVQSCKNFGVVRSGLRNNLLRGQLRGPLRRRLLSSRPSLTTMNLDQRRSWMCNASVFIEKEKLPPYSSLRMQSRAVRKHRIGVHEGALRLYRATWQNPFLCSSKKKSSSSLGSFMARSDPLLEGEAEATRIPKNPQKMR